MDDPYLLTPGPLTTSSTVKRAMLRDWGSRDPAFIEMNRAVRDRLVELASASATHVCVPVQGSGTFAIEATLGTMLAPADKLLVLVNGAYGRRMAAIAEVTGRSLDVLEWREDEAVDAHLVARRLDADPAITHVGAVHCETTTGILNPLAEIAEVVADRSRRLIVDAMSSFGALDIDARSLPFEALVASSNKCLEGVPGIGFALINANSLATCEGHASSLSLDLHAQWRGFEQNSQWRFTPPTHVVAALAQALEEHAAEGGVQGRGDRYRRNHRTLVEGMEAMGFQCLIDHGLQAPIIVTFMTPADPRFIFDDFYSRLVSRGFVIYPGKLTVADTFRIGCIGRIDEAVVRSALEAVQSVLTDMGVTDARPAPRATT